MKTLTLKQFEQVNGGVAPWRRTMVRSRGSSPTKAQVCGAATGAAAAGTRSSHPVVVAGSVALAAVTGWACSR